MQACVKLISTWPRMCMCVTAKARRTGRRRLRKMCMMSLMMVAVLLVVVVVVWVVSAMVL